jgi:hypothetical protein
MKTLIMEILTDPYLIQSSFSGFLQASYECENPFGKPLVRLKVYSLSCPAF